MSGFPGVPGLGVTPLVSGLAVSTSNPLPISGGGGVPFPVTVGAQLVFTAPIVNALAGTNGNVLIAPTAGKSIYVTSYIFSLTTAANAYFCQDTGEIVSAQGVGVIAGNESAGSNEAYLFATAAGKGLNLALSAAQALAGVQVRYRVG